MSENLTVGADPIVAALIPVQLTNADGIIEEHLLRRLGVRDVFRIARIIAAGAAMMGNELNFADIKSESMSSTMSMLLLLGFPMAESHCIELLADIIGIKPSDLADPNKYGMTVVPEIIAALIQHQDLKAFFTSLGALMAAPGMSQALNRK